jgi:uncharacterized protein
MINKKIVTKILIIILFLGISYSIMESYSLRIKEDEILSDDLPNSFNKLKIVFISDIHCSWYFGEKKVKKVADRINELNPDIIILGGDYTYGSIEYINKCFKGLKGLKSKYGVFAVLGNHDYGENKEETERAILKNGFYLINNKSYDIIKGKEKIRIGGVGDYIYDTQDLNKVTKNIENRDFLLLVSHNPDFVEEIKEEKVDLVLSGHTHGGQLTFFRKWFPLINSNYGEKYLGGIVRNKETTVIVSHGVGTIVLPMRFYARPEINLITIREVDFSRK